ncbi:MAG TPA: hypothetical protein VKP08_14040, partial [Anaerolineales bacterium]|nr:hypothetical protein [Anaerolineales bacterium]
MDLVNRKIPKVLLISLAILSICGIAAVVLYIFLPSISIGFPEKGWKVWEPNWSPAGNLIAFRCVFMSSENWDFDSYDLDVASNICVTDQN